MHYPSKEEFIAKSKQGNLIPVYKEILADVETPVSAFQKIDQGEYSYLLESVEKGEKVGRFSFLGGRPSLVFKSKGKEIEIIESDTRAKYKIKKIPFESNPLAKIKELMGKFKFVEVEGLPRFCGGMVGYMGYDTVRFFEKLPDENPDDLNLPDCMFILTDTILIFDHVDRKIKVVSNAHIEKQKSGNRRQISEVYEESIKKIDSIIDRLKKTEGRKQKTENRPQVSGELKIKSNFTQSEFEQTVLKAKKYIKAGDIIQVVLSQRFEIDLVVSPFDVYRYLRSLNPSPYMFYLKFQDITLVGSSPELHVRCEDDLVEIRPIAGTRQRGKNEKEDNRFTKDLLGDPKERAEHIMLVDLGRNDVGRVCRYKSVNVGELMTIEKYSHVIHIVSDITGRLKKNEDSFSLLKVTFPAGTVTGAPKIRAMEIIDELEKTRRGPYAGVVGYFSFSGNLDTCITIRTLVIKGNKAYIQAGAGIVAYSDPAKEYQETINKSKALVEAIKLAQEGL
ncbi:MAG: anthranilate synthase component I [Candidatus Omnitrophota bacterium]|nr:anthranilate synthase component I [Candidatus Omnitrophota bacterium]